MSAFDLRSLFLPAVFILYGIGYMLVGMLNVQSYWVGSFFKVPFLFALFGVRLGRILSGILCIGGGVWFYTLMV